MKNILVILFILIPALVFSQQLDFTSGKKLSGANWSLAGQVYLDTTASTSTDFYVDLSDYYWAGDIRPLVIDYDLDFGTGADSTLDGTVKTNSDRMLIGSLYTYFDTQGIEAPTTDSVKHNITVYPGVYYTDSRSLSAVKWGTAVTLEEVTEAGDYLSIVSVYIKDAIKAFPPEVLKFSIVPATTKVTALDDSVACYWRFVYPEVYQQQKEHINESD